MTRLFACSLLVAALPACSVYGPFLFDDLGDGGSTSGGSTGNGGSTSGGGSGTGGLQPSGGSGGSSGGSETGGSDAGGADTGGSGGNGATETLVDDFSGGFAQYANPPFAGFWKREAQTAGGSCTAAVWAAASVADMIQEVPDETDEAGLRVQATALNCWGVDIYATLNDAGSPMALDVSGYTGIRFRARRANAEGSLKVALEDTASNYNAGACGGASPAPDCNKHAVSTAVTALNDTWRTITVPFASFYQGNPPTSGSSSGPRMVALDLEHVYAIHFTLDPAGSEVDFWIDDVRFYTE